MTGHTCSLCYSPDNRLFYEDARRIYLQCQKCFLVFVPPFYHLSSEAEKARYDLHQNSPEDPGYRRFLSRIFNPMQARLKPKSKGLDFGSGPEPVLSKMFEESGHSMNIYDIHYEPDMSVWNEDYDFITASEVVEHLRKPEKELYRLWGCLKPEGNLGVMTKLVIDQKTFKSWHYKRDMTHISFFSRSTFRWMAIQFGTEAEFVDKDVVIFRKSRTEPV